MAHPSTHTYTPDRIVSTTNCIQPLHLTRAQILFIKFNFWKMGLQAAPFLFRLLFLSPKKCSKRQQHVCAISNTFEPRKLVHLLALLLPLTRKMLIRTWKKKLNTLIFSNYLKNSQTMKRCRILFWPFSTRDVTDLKRFSIIWIFFWRTDVSSIFGGLQTV